LCQKVIREINKESLSSVEDGLVVVVVVVVVLEINLEKVYTEKRFHGR